MQPLVAKRFSKAAAIYEHHAQAQQVFAQRLMQRLPNADYAQVLDVGAGTGLLRKHWPQSCPTPVAYVALDIAPNMLQQAQNQGAVAVLGDMHQLPFGAERFDLVLSSFALQWASDVNQVFIELNRVARPGALIALCTVVEGSLWQLDKAWRQSDGSSRVNRFVSAPRIKALASVQGWQPLDYSSDEYVCHYPDVMSLLAALRGVGANTVLNHQQGLRRGQLVKLAQAYEPLRNEQGLPLSYQLVSGVWRKDD